LTVACDSDSPSIQAVIALLGSSRRPLIVFHEHPDGDAIGSALALAHGLRQRGAVPTIACADAIGAYYRFLPGSGMIHGPESARPDGEAFDLAIMVDCADFARAGSLQDMVRECPRLVNIDHHPTNNGYGDAALVVPEAAASGELIAAVLRGLGATIDADIATCIFTAIMTDTGSFRYSNTSAASFDLAAAMVRAGARPELISDAVYEQRPRGDIELLAAGLGRLHLSADGRIAWMSVTQEDLARTDGDSEGLVNYARMIAGVEVAMVFREEADGSVKVSLRSRRIDVAGVAHSFGGGGHPRAAGLTYSGSLSEAESALLGKVTAALTAESGGE
jgi:phosphoesterase RecJ-like protein